MRHVIKGFILWIWYYLYKPYRDKRKVEAKRRIIVCEKCEHFNKTLRTCELCGCFMDIKVILDFELDEEGISIDGCWDRKW